MSTYEIRPTEGGADQESSRTPFSLLGPDAERSVMDFEPSSWFRSVMREITDQWDACGIPVCAHVGGEVMGVLTLRDEVRGLTCPACASTPVNVGTCDHCGASGGTMPVVIEARHHRPEHRLDGVRFLVGFGLCEPCWVAEVGPDDES